jgi:hypothetical protein
MEDLLTMALMANVYLLEVLGYAARAAGKLDFLIQAQEGKGLRQWITKLQKVAKYDHDTHEASFSDAALMLATWYREHGNIIEARNCSRVCVLQALDMLSDDDPYNDSHAWLALSKSLLKAGIEPTLWLHLQSLCRNSTMSRQRSPEGSQKPQKPLK